MSETGAHVAVEAAVRNSYGRLIAYLAARSGDVAAAEDALGDALVAALRRWPEEGVPRQPEAWLLQAARNRLIDAARHDEVRRRSEETVHRIADQARQLAESQGGFPDERLKLLFVCAHPAIDPASRTPLMLQTVLGIDAAQIASAFLVSPAAMSQRLVRAKTKIRDAGIPFRVPDPADESERISFVLDAIYSAYTAGWDRAGDAGSALYGLAAEAVALGRTLVELMPAEPEARGLLALMLHCEARRDARYSASGAFIPLDQQDTSRWQRPMIDEAEAHLRTAATENRIGRYQLEAAIQSIHAERAVRGSTDWPQIVLLYEGLLQISPGIGSEVSRAVALAKADRLPEGLAALDAIPEERIVSYQPYWAARGHLLQWLGRQESALAALTRAASLTDDPAQREYLFRRAAECQ